MQDQLRNVEEVKGTDGAFTALLADRSVVTWGHPHSGGDSSAVQNQVKGVQHVEATVLRSPRFWQMDLWLHGAM